MDYLKIYFTICLISSLLVNCPTSTQFDTKNGEQIGTVRAHGLGGYLLWPRANELILVDDAGFFSIIPSSGETQKILDSDKIPISPLDGETYIVYATVVLSKGKYTIYYLADERESGFRYNKGGLYKLDEGKNTPEKVLEGITHAKVSEDGSSIAYVRSGKERLSDSLFVYNVETKESKYFMKGLPLKFSPGNGSLLVDSPDEYFQLSILDLSNNTETPLNFDNKYLYEQKELAIRWDDLLPDFVFAEDREQRGETGSTIKKWDGAEQASEKIWNLPPEESFGLTLPIAWSADRNKIAKWTDRCYNGLVGNCDQRRFSLHLIQNTSGSSRTVAKTEVSGSSLAFSPDGSKLGYVTKVSSTEKAKIYVVTTN